MERLVQIVFKSPVRHTESFSLCKPLSFIILSCRRPMARLVVLKTMAYWLSFSLSFNVTVGGLNETTPIVAFTPHFVNAYLGDQLVFFFTRGNHTVSQSHVLR